MQRYYPILIKSSKDDERDFDKIYKPAPYYYLILLYEFRNTYVGWLREQWQGRAEGYTHDGIRILRPLQLELQ